ncbi:hypothetical protein EUA93_04670 [Nocardioides oleivorans]|uniref:Uncharacterized protein n=1 Tax=Nocardioides oleivorans TaxID=273676 RepID=A0A4Q2RWW3_9ACTN|nr:hypothetical protein [Nocardioides oleivorans]RYB93711.1 hypothetical protein EUA93_04670 [Nocardioides oleivorans]
MIEQRFQLGSLSDAEAITEIRSALQENVADLEEIERAPAVLQCLRIVDRVGHTSPDTRRHANDFRQWADRTFPQSDETFDHLEIDARRLDLANQHADHTAWLRSRVRSAPLGLSMANRLSLMDVALENGIAAALGDSLRWRSGIRGGIAAPGLVEPHLTEWAVRALFVLLQRRENKATALHELIAALRDPLLAPIVARLATNTMLTGDKTRMSVTKGVAALRQVLGATHDEWTADEMSAAETAARWLEARLAATTHLSTS